MNASERQKLNEWIVDTVKKDYRGDIALVIFHNTLKVDDTIPEVSYFVPVTDRGRSFARNFIIAGEGQDIWAMEWERLEQFAALEEYNVTCLADAEIAYAASEADANRFEALQKKQAENLKDKALMRKNALQAYAEARKIYAEMQFADVSDFRMCAGYVMDYLAQAIAYSNLTYFRKSQIDQRKELKGMKEVPEGFDELYANALRAVVMEEQNDLIKQMVILVRDFLEKKAEKTKAPDPVYEDMAAWYEELSYTWFRIYHYCAVKDCEKAYMWGIMLQLELNRACEEYGLEKCALMEAYQPNDLERFDARAKELEQRTRRFLEQKGIRIREFESVEEFLHEV